MTQKNDLVWESVSISQLCTFERGKENNMASLAEGEIPLVSARKVNNGIKGFVACPSKIIEGGKVLSLNNDGDGGAGLAFYQPFDFALDSHVTALHLKNNLSAQALIFMAACISKQHAIFGHGYSISLPRAKRILSMLPVKDSGSPDFQYMDDYISGLRDKLLERYNEYLIKKIKVLGDLVAIIPLNKKQWKDFALDEIFTISAGKRLETRNKVPGNRPFIGATDNCNGVTGFVSNDNVSRDRNVLGVNYNGAPCIAFYHPYECIFTDDVKRLHLRHYSDNIFVLLFFVTIFAQQRSKFSYGYKFNEQRMLKQKLMLPIDETGNPDYMYMEQYAKNIMIRKYNQYLNFINHK